MKNMRIRTKLVIWFVIVDVMFLILGIAGYFSVAKMDGAENSKNVMWNYIIFSTILLVIIYTIMTIFAVIILRTIRHSSNQLSSIGKDIAKGKIDIDVAKEYNDEFGDVVDEFGEVVRNLQSQAAVVEEVAKGNLTVNVQPKGEEDIMGNALKKMVLDTHHAMSNIHDAAYQVMSGSSEVASASEALAQGSTEQASAIEEITASINDIAEKTKANAAEATNAASLMNEALEDVDKGNEQMKYMLGAMDEINQASNGISKIIKVIDDIAFQTNILALNAAVEAARAGDAGMGFAVVAEEVRNLAAKSAAAAAETAEMIEDSIKKVQNGSDVMTETAKSLEEISDVVSKSEKIIRGIAESSNYQATAIEQIDQAVEQVSQVVQSNSSTSEECAAASMELSGQAERMRTLVSAYQLGGSAQVVNTSRTSYGGNYHQISDKNESIISLKDGFGKY